MNCNGWRVACEIEMVAAETAAGTEKAETLAYRLQPSTGPFVANHL